jgi:DNA-binding winged helix-turn-helix (wHTH) protein
MDALTQRRFGRVTVEPGRPQLLIDGQPAKIGARAFDILVALIERRQRVVSKDELLDLVWPGVTVEEGNLQVQMVALRKLLGAATIATIPGRGYKFTATIEGVDAPPVAAPGEPAANSAFSNYPRSRRNFSVERPKLQRSRRCSSSIEWLRSPVRAASARRELRRPSLMTCAPRYATAPGADRQA